MRLIFNIVPCVLISFMTLLGFLLPPDSGEKLTLRKEKNDLFLYLVLLFLIDRNYNSSFDRYVQFINLRNYTS